LRKKNPRIDIKNNEGETVRNIIEDHSDRRHYLKYLPKAPRNESDDVDGLLNTVEPEEDISDEETIEQPKKETLGYVEEKNSEDKKEKVPKKESKKKEKKKNSDSDADLEKLSRSDSEVSLDSEEELEVDEKVLTYMRNYAKKITHAKSEKKRRKELREY